MDRDIEQAADLAAPPGRGDGTRPDPAMMARAVRPLGAAARQKETAMSEWCCDHMRVEGVCVCDQYEDRDE